jgi:hypothetical protein
LRTNFGADDAFLMRGGGRLDRPFLALRKLARFGAETDRFRNENARFCPENRSKRPEKGLPALFFPSAK